MKSFVLQNEKKEDIKEVDPATVAEELTVLQVTFIVYKEHLFWVFPLQNQLQLLLKDETLQPILNPKYEVEKQALVQEGLSKKLINELQTFASKTESKQSDPKDDSQVWTFVSIFTLLFTPICSV